MRLSTRYLVAVFMYSLICSALVSLHAAGHGPTFTLPAGIFYCLARSLLFFLAFSFLGVPMAYVCLSLYRTARHHGILHCLLFGIMWGCGTLGVLAMLLTVSTLTLSASGHDILNWSRALGTSLVSSAIAGLVFWVLSPSTGCKIAS
ncbi:hypothetical protein [Acetobacter orleanensis]|uniref:Uncharacterized protein n=1 Tax=Acetobacter orleanensis TaxID=104099 RepID=A0A4Y3TH65_9PROT|nr:hypothetical protein [Acetobacter orleanensis]KXV65231.1 hypothetical protein AD949_05060 [Acetobacter orleanensis]PCD79619.1 hypothetical protein CO710_05245 [Acetobacter orleanensis]GAN68715.1 hypothetical protein Abol_021_070 [Acetobacter orleanensis JCM 7639]GEB82311.1 hypothetical protein AOR01nite_07880 [Acetobacter orleanensis]